MKSAIVLAVLLGSGGASFSQVAELPRVEDNFVPWLGCWRLVEDDIREPLLRGESTELGKEPVPLRALVCMSPSSDGSGVIVTTSTRGEAFLTEPLVANGERTPSTRGECTGWQEADWSADGHRLFTRSELTCERSRKLQVSGLSLIVVPATWVEIQVVDDGRARAVVVRRYRPSEEEAGSLSPELSSAASRARGEIADVLDVDDIIEIVKRAEPEVVEAAVLEMKDEGFEMDAHALTLLDDAGARPGLIDLMVALSYPDEFDVGRNAPGEGGVAGGFELFDALGSAGLYPYYAAPFGYYYWYAPYDPVYVIRPPSVPEGGVDVGRVIKGRGYTRVTRTQGGSGHWGSSEGGDWSSGGGSSGGSASPGGYSSHGDSGRTAKPKEN
jgi:uncharacterized membrane protein YgcG